MLKRFSLQSIFLLVLVASSFCQNDGVPPFSLFESHQVDSINLQNLTIQLLAPVINKAGAIPFSFVLNGSSSCATGKSWACGIGSTKGANGYWKTYVLVGLGPGLAGGYSAIPTITGSFYYCPDGVTETLNDSGWVIVDPFGTQHPLPPSDFVDEYGCTSNNTFTDHTTDGSGLFLSIHAAQPITSGYTYIYDRNGDSTNVNYGLLPFEKDTNANSITVSSNASNDTLWTDTLALTALTSRDATSNLYGYYKWTDVNGGTQEISSSFTAASPIKTAFGCPNVTDTNANISLLSRLNYPDGSAISFSYETNSDGSYTGRIGSITLRTGGNVSYGYSGGNSGINCTYAVPPVSVRL